jgi:hypothetical protein
VIHRPLQVAVIAAIAVAMASTSVDAQRRQGSGQGKGRGTCGSTLSVVLPDGSERTFSPAEDFLKDMPRHGFSQGEEVRTATTLTAMLKDVGASWVRVLDCNDVSHDLPEGLPFEGEVHVVVSGRKSLKFAREVRPGVYKNIAQNVKRLRFHAASTTPGADRPKEGR